MNNLKVGIDISGMNQLSKERGIGFYVMHLYKSLKKYTDCEVTLIEEIGRKPDTDLIHYPFFDFFSPTLPWIKSIPTVVTVHDVTPLIFPEHYPPGVKGKINFIRQKLSLKNTKAVITDSFASKKDIIKYLDTSEDKIFKVYLAPDEKFRPEKNIKKLEAIRKRYGLPQKYALFVGNINWNKNLMNLTQGCIDTGIDLFLVGSAFKTRENLEHPELVDYKLWLQKYSNHKKIHIIDTYPEDDIVGIYNLAEVLLLPSFYEGFGLPVLEAQACGTPVVTSNVSSMPEISGSGAIVVDPNKPIEIMGAIESLENKTLKEKLIKNGLANSEKYSWRKVAEETMSVYQNVISKKY